VVGAKGIVDQDLGYATKSHPVTYLFSPAETRTERIGGTRFGALLTLDGSLGM
jgi:hypothetical protein